MQNTRRKFIKQSGQFTLGLGLIGLSSCSQTNSTPKSEMKKEKAPVSTNPAPMFFSISLAQWSLNKTIFAGKLDNLDFAATAKNTYGIDGVEYVNQFFKDKAEDQKYLQEMKKRATDNGVKSLLIMIDEEGDLGNTNDKERTKAIENHVKWLDAAKFLGCHPIRVNARGVGSNEEVGKAAVDGLGRLAELGAKRGLNVIVENHGGQSSNGAWLAGVMKEINMPNCGTLPDFGNFCIERSKEEKCLNEYDRYKGITELMPYAKAVSAKSNEFDANGNETKSDFMRIMKIVKEAAYKGYVGIEYEGSKLGEHEGILATKKLLEKVGKALS